MSNLFPQLIPEPINTLTQEERAVLVMTVEGMCRSLARSAAREAPGLEAEDAEQEAFMVAVECASRWAPTLGPKFSTYAGAAIRRHLTNLVTKAKNTGEVFLEDWEGMARADLEDDDAEPRPVTLTTEQEDALSRLGEVDREAVRLVLAGLGPDRIAARLNREIKDVKLILRNAARQLRRDLAWLSRPDLFTEENADAA